MVFHHLFCLTSSCPSKTWIHYFHPLNITSPQALSHFRRQVKVLTWQEGPARTPSISFKVLFSPGCAWSPSPPLAHTFLFSLWCCLAQGQLWNSQSHRSSSIPSIIYLFFFEKHLLALYYFPMATVQMTTNSMASNTTILLSHSPVGWKSLEEVWQVSKKVMMGLCFFWRL